MMRAVSVAFLLVLLCIELQAQWIKRREPRGIIERKDYFWVVEASGPINQPRFPAYIRFYNTYTRESEFEIDVSSSLKVLYLPDYSQIVFLTKGHRWSEGDSYYITLDEGVLYSNEIENSTDYLSPDFWQFQVGRPSQALGY